MSLLPKTAGEFQLKEYWDKFFTKRSSAFEWYGEYTDLCHILHKYLKHSNSILIVGCGNSRLSEDLFDVGFHSIHNIDISDVVVRQMTARNKDKRPEMKFVKMDMLHMSYDDSSFDCVIDKGTLDAIFCNNDEVTVSKVDCMFNEIKRVLKLSGRYVCITLAQEHILEKILKRFESNWLLRVHRVLLGTDTTGGGGVGGALPVFVFVLTKMAIIEGRPPMKVRIVSVFHTLSLTFLYDYLNVGFEVEARALVGCCIISRVYSSFTYCLLVLYETADDKNSVQ